jgi:hypothetical protein
MKPYDSFGRKGRMLIRRRQRCSSGHRRAATVHLERSDGHDNNDSVRHEAAGPALDVEELFHAYVGAEARFSDHETVTPDLG